MGRRGSEHEGLSIDHLGSSDLLQEREGDAAAISDQVDDPQPDRRHAPQQERRGRVLGGVHDRSTADLVDGRIEAIQEPNVPLEIPPIPGREHGQDHEEDVAIPIDPTLQIEDPFDVQGPPSPERQPADLRPERAVGEASPRSRRARSTRARAPRDARSRRPTRAPTLDSSSGRAGCCRFAGNRRCRAPAPHRRPVGRRRDANARQPRHGEPASGDGAPRRRKVSADPLRWSHCRQSQAGPRNHLPRRAVPVPCSKQPALTRRVGSTSGRVSSVNGRRCPCVTPPRNAR